MSEKAGGVPAHLVSGFFGGLASVCALQPLDLLKTRLQQAQASSLRSVLREVRTTRELWRGTLPSALRTSIGSALYLSLLNYSRSALARGSEARTRSSLLPRLQSYQNLLTGALSRAAVGLVTMPITVIKVRYESTLYAYNGLAEATRHIWRSEGARGFFKGAAATTLRDAPYAGLYVLLYEQAKEMLPRALPATLLGADESGKLTAPASAMVNGVSAFLSASLATTLTAPFDTIKTRMQLQSHPVGFVQTLRHIVCEERARTLFDGLSLRLCRKAMSACIAWGIYEELLKLLH
ncbi:AGR383Wp [Eremothecium gossypii ATCC 10895]|uniref:Mitochondrial glycine transporter n=1 Tax=Eremothecium gossypii (strain ATCC 10895 / CBS 109.51 / FGSC 9923 / NRRL Y-1056) TaxID=284811 RepID=S2538_EREGS|nr:AGR383Wp [Eremothecium gossypii ATCC 10895]Q74Z23.1 RecName: Full=Mitochondrial glycine transporter; AltName: Full=Solute carrier family 25 member 38 homolog [Eremothecium gossypii ATCC 10895]AAS54873.1 AGR383Wp [Eremothecium gossypii ATCC 10895]AEY99205.1 FAGR383Wp [Eremothecium gossypii FDAG1]